MKPELDLLRTESPAHKPGAQGTPGAKRYILPLVVLVLLVAVWKLRSHPSPAAGTAGSGTIAKTTPPTPVKEAVVSTGAVTRTVEVSGDIAALTEVTLAPKIAARVTSVIVREGDRVHRGQLLITLDTSDLDSQVRSAEAALASAQAMLSSAQAKASQALVAARLQQSSSRLGIQTAQEAVRSSQARLEEAQRGARRQEKMQAQAAVKVAQANLDDAQTNYNRNLTLFQQGAVAQASVDTAETHLKVMQAQRDTANEQLSLVNEGTRPEEIVQYEAAVQQAKQGLSLAQENERQVAMKWEDYRSSAALARQSAAGVRQARAQVALAEANRSNAFLQSPVDGVIEKRTVEPGQLASAGAPLLKITVPGTVFFSAEVSERDLGQLRKGQPVMVGVDAFPNERFEGHVTQIYPAGDVTSRTFTVRITLSDAGGRLRPGMFARGAIVVARRENVPLVPKAALTAAGSPIPLEAATETGIDSSVFVVRDGATARKPVRIGAPAGDNVEVIRGLAPGDRVIVAGSRLEEGQKVDVTH